MTHQSYVRHIMSKSRKETKESQGERSKNAVKTKIKSHYCTHIEQLKPKITFKRMKTNASETLGKSQRKHRENVL